MKKLRWSSEVDFESELKGRTRRRRRENPRLTWVEIVEKNVREMRGKNGDTRARTEKNGRLMF
jgi:hypothetical protein